MNTLVPCPECNRHLRRNEAACPFCGADVAATMARVPERAMPTTRLSRSALFAFAAASVGAVACSSGAVGNAYGAPPFTGGTSSIGGGDGSGGEMATPLYGAPVFAGGMTGAGGKASVGGSAGAGGQMAVPAYGLPAFTGGKPGTDGDAGEADAATKGTGGTFAALYGGIPPTFVRRVAGSSEEIVSNDSAPRG